MISQFSSNCGIDVMSDIEITIKLPEDLVREARASELLTGEKIAELLQAELDRREDRQKHLAVFLEIAAQLSAVEPKLSQKEIDAARREHPE
jgi:hypothetical protein